MFYRVVDPAVILIIEPDENGLLNPGSLYAKLCELALNIQDLTDRESLRLRYGEFLTTNNLRGCVMKFTGNVIIISDDPTN